MDQQPPTPQYGDLADILQQVGKDPSRLVFEDELTGIHNRRFLRSYFEHRVRWDSDRDFPLSLLVIDLDKFKAINDTHGHDTGDQVLTWMASLLKEIAGERGLPVRYGGDEFMLILPKASRSGAREVADRLLQRSWDRPFRLRDAGLVVPVTLSIGVASAPEDGKNSRELFQAADTALYHAKQSGRNQAASASEIDVNKVFPKTALHRLIATGIHGRDAQLATVAACLQGLSQGQSQFLIVEGGPGMGKTAFLDTVRQNLVSNEALAVVKVVGDQQEGFRPYYLATRLVLALLNQKADKGVELLQSLTPQEVSHLAEILPQLQRGDAPAGEQDESAKRQGIFATLTDLLPRLVEDRPLVAIVDDLHLADEATLLLFRTLMRREQSPVFVCGSTMEFLKLAADAGAPPLERFFTARKDELNIRRARLGPLSGEDIGDYLRGVFPSLRMPEGFEADLVRITQGNPLFLGEILRKLVGDRRVTLVGQEWVIEPLEPGYLPRSLDDIVMEKIAALDEEGRQLLEKASTLGEDVSLSVLAGSSDLDENRVLEFLDRAEALGLVSMDFQVNDESMRFLGKRVLEISYGAIDEARRKELHEQVGTYQEGLYEQRLLPSASLLAYHFKRSANQEKARRYERIQLVFSQTVFDPEETAAYTGEVQEEEVEAEPRLHEDSLRYVPEVLRTFMKAVRSVQLYPPESDAVLTAIEDVKQPIDAILVHNEWLHFSHAQNVLLGNGQRLNVSDLQLLADGFRKLLHQAELQGLVFKQGVSEKELRALLVALSSMKGEAIEFGYWRAFGAEHGLDHIEFQQMRYSRVRKRKTKAQPGTAGEEEEELGVDELAELPKVVRALLAATKISRLYPMNSKPVTRAIQQLYESLERILARRRVLSLAGVDQNLLVNGARADVAGLEGLAASLLQFLDQAALKSISFYSNVTPAELETFLAAVKDLPSSGIDRKFWEEFAREKGLAGLTFNKARYAVGVVQSMLAEGDMSEQGDEAETDPTVALVEQIPEQDSAQLWEVLQRYGKDLLVKGEHKLVKRLIKRLFHDYGEQDATSRARAATACRAMLDGLILGLQHRFAQLAVDSLLVALSEEDDPQVLRELTGVLYAMSSCAVQFADYDAASRILLDLRARQQQFAEQGGRDAESFIKLFDRKLDAKVYVLLEEDLRSGDAGRQLRAAQVVGSLGRAGIPLLIDVIKQERDLRVRQMAASLLTEVGPDAAKEIKRAVVTEVIVEHRARMLEVIDTVATDLERELQYSLADGNPRIMRQAFRLFERLGRDDLIDAILPHVNEDQPAEARGAIRSLGQLRSAAAVDALMSILERIEDPKLAGACCQALGEIGDASAVEVLGRVLADRKFGPFGRRWGEDVRSTAAMALYQIGHPRAVEVLQRFTKDPDERVRQLAQSVGS